MQLKKAERKQVRIKMAIQGVSGSGKTYSALLLAFGLTNNWSKIGVIDSENSSASLYAHLGDFNIISVSYPFSPEKYIQAVEICVREGMEVIVIDSISHCWENLLEYHASLQGNSFANWGKVNPRYNGFMQCILSCNAHVISTIRAKSEYVISDKDGKKVPEKIGLKGIQREGIEYEFTLMFNISMDNLCKVSKDRTGIFQNRNPFKINSTTGKEILNWCEQGSYSNSDSFFSSIEQVKTRIEKCMSMDELLNIYQAFPQFQQQLLPDFKALKKKLLQNQH